MIFQTYKTQLFLNGVIPFTVRGNNIIILYRKLNNIKKVIFLIQYYLADNFCDVLLNVITYNIKQYVVILYFLLVDLNLFATAARII